MRKKKNDFFIFTLLKLLKVTFLSALLDFAAIVLNVALKKPKKNIMKYEYKEIVYDILFFFKYPHPPQIIVNIITKLIYIII